MLLGKSIGESVERILAGWGGNDLAARVAGVSDSVGLSKGNNCMLCKGTVCQSLLVMLARCMRRSLLVMLAHAHSTQRLHFRCADCTYPLPALLLLLVVFASICCQWTRPKAT